MTTTVTGEPHRMMQVLNRDGDPAVVVFSGKADLPWLRILEPGFRHCFAALSSADGWVVIEALSTGVVVSRLAARDPFDLAEAYRAIGCRAVVTTCRKKNQQPLPWSPFTCVESVKRLIGLQGRSVITPYRLWRKIVELGKNT